MTENLATNLNFTHLCRCCALEYNLMYDIFCGTCSNAQTYYEVIMECAPVKLFRDDGLPSLVCYKCVLILESFVVFRRKCIESESILKRMSNNASLDKQEMFSLNRAKQINPLLTVVKEESIDIDYTTEPEIEFDAPVKDSVSEKYPVLKSYEIIKIENTTVDESWPDTDSQADRLDSEIGQRLIESSMVVKEFFDGSEKPHLDTDRTERKPSNGRFKLYKRRRTRTGKKSYTCGECAKSFTFESNFKRHQEIHTDEKPFVCDRCDRSFKRKSKLYEHRKLHTGGRLYPCDRCDKSFAFKSYLDRHRKTHTSDKPYSCDECEKSFGFRSGLNRHKKIHAGEKSYSCGECDKSFIFKSDLDRHRETHTAEKPYTCDGCDKSFKRKSKLKEHRKSHVAERPYPCDTCEKSFAYSSDLNRHRVIHRNEKPYSCDDCEKSFNCKSYLNKHRIIHTDRKPYSCDRCEKSFNFVSNLRAHHKTHECEKPCE